jgi:hypothetical protein
VVGGAAAAQDRAEMEIDRARLLAERQ